jgi:iron(III) transport system substrate-binding protein
MIEINGTRVLLAAMAVTVLALGAARADLKAIESEAKKEGQVTWYVANLDARNAEAAGRVFTTKYGIKVNIIRAPSQTIYQRLAQDLAQGVANADVISTADVGNFVALKQKDALALYKPENAAKLLPAFRDLDPDGYFYTTVASPLIVAYNKDKVRPEEVPQRWSDFTDAKWAGKLAFGHPAYSGFAGNWAVQVTKLYGREYLEKIEKLKPHVGRSLFDAVNLVTSGERLVAPTPVGPIMERADKGNPVAIHYPADGAILVSTPGGVVKNAPHPNAARLFMEFLLGPEFGEILAKARYEVMRADVKALPGVKSMSEVKVIRPTIEETTTGIPKVTEIWRSIFGQ